MAANPTEPAYAPQRAGSANRLALVVHPEHEHEVGRYPRVCRHGHIICGPADESGWDQDGQNHHHLQCVKCRVYSQGVAWCRWGFRRWLWSLGWDDQSSADREVTA